MSVEVDGITSVEEVVTPQATDDSGEVQDSELEDAVDTDDESTEDDGQGEQEDEDEDGEGDDSETVPKKQTAEERKAQLQKEIQDLANQRRELKESLEKELVEKIQLELSKQKEEAPPYVEVDWDRLNDHIADELRVIDDLKDEGKAAEALFKQRQLEKLYDQVEANEKLRTDWEAKKMASEAENLKLTKLNQEIAQASDLVRKAMSVSEEEWKLGETWFLEKRRTDPLVDAQYRELVFNKGPTHALKWAHDYVVENMGAKAKQEKQKREEGKKKTVGGSSSSSEAMSKVPKTFDDLMKLPEAEIMRLEKANPKLFNKLLSSKYK